MGKTTEIEINLGVIPEGVQDIKVTLTNATKLKEYTTTSELQSKSFSLTDVDMSNGTHHYIEIELTGRRSQLLDRIFIDSDLRPEKNEFTVHAIAGRWKLEKPLPAAIDGVSEYDTAVIQPMATYECQSTHVISLLNSATGKTTRDGSICYIANDNVANIYDQREIPIRRWASADTYTQDILVVNTNYDNLKLFKGHVFPRDLGQKIDGNNPYRLMEKDRTIETVFHFATVAINSPLQRIDSTIQNFDKDISKLDDRISKAPARYKMDDPKSFPIRIRNCPGYSFYRTPKWCYKVFLNAYAEDVYYTISDNCEYRLYRVPARKIS
jgi:hypothetical protein